MKQSDFLEYLYEKVRDYKQRWNLETGSGFAMWYAVEGMGLDEEVAYEAVSFDGGNDKGVDLFYVDHESERVVISQLRYRTKGNYRAKRPDLLNLLHTTDWLMKPEDLEREGREDLAAAGRDYLDAVGKSYSVDFLFIYAGPANKDVADTAKQFNVNEADSTPSRFCRVLHMEDLRTVHEEFIDQESRISAEKIPIEPGMVYEETGEFGRAVVTVVSGDLLRKLYEKYGYRLFDRNVRLFLGSRKGSVNAGIRDTLESEKERKNFWAYNNGVTFICDRFSLGDSEIDINNFSVVNGCQTTVSIANAPPAAAEDVRVLVRFIAAQDGRIIDSIIRYTNSQNPIRPWDLNAQDRLQKKLKKQLAGLEKPFLYALRKGESRQLTGAEKEKFKRNGKIQLIPHDVNAQYLAAFGGLPAVAYKDKGKIFTTHREQVFPDQIRPEDIVLVWQAGQAASELVKAELEKAAEENEGERLKILKRGGKFFVLAVMSVILHERNGNTFLNRLDQTVASSKRTHKRLTNYARIALEWYVDAMRELVAAGNEVPALVRTQDGWLKIKPKVAAKWKIFELSKRQMEEALPKL